MLRKLLTVAAVVLAAGFAQAEPPMSGGTSGSLSWKKDIETQTPAPGASGGGGMERRIRKIADQLGNAGQGGLVKETCHASLGIAFKIKVTHHSKGFDLKLRWRETSWSVSPNTPADLEAALVADKVGLETRLGMWERAATREEWIKLEKGEAISVSIADAYKGVEMLAGDAPALEARWGSYEITGFSVIDQSYKNNMEMDDKIVSAEEKLRVAKNKYDEEFAKLTKLTEESDAAKSKAAEKKLELNHASHMRDFEDEVRKKLAELAKADKDIDAHARTMDQKFRDTVEKLKKNTGLKPGASDKELLDTLAPDTEIAVKLRKQNELFARRETIRLELVQVQKKYNEKYKIDMLEAQLAALTKAVPDDEICRKQSDMVFAALREHDSRYTELSDLKLAWERARELGPLRFKEVIVTGTSGELYRAKVETDRELFDELNECEKRLEFARNEKEDAEQLLPQVRADALRLKDDAVKARASWEVWFNNSLIYFSQAAFVAGFEAAEVGWEFRNGGPTAAVAEVLKKGGERLVQGFVFGKWGEDYKEPDQPKIIDLPELNKKFANEMAGMSTAKGLLGQVVEHPAKLPWKEFKKMTEVYYAVKPKLTSLKGFATSAAGFAKEGAKKAVGELLLDGLIKDRLKDNCELNLANYFDERATKVFLQAEIRSIAAARLWLKTSNQFWEAQAAWRTQLDLRNELAGRLATKTLNDVVKNVKFPDGDSLRIDLVKVEEKASLGRKVTLMVGDKEAGRLANLEDYSYRVEATDLNEPCMGGVELKAVIRE